MAMDALKNISTNVPDWLHKLGELGGQIEKRQVELAALSPQTPPRSVKSVKKTGSTESLRPNDNNERREPITPFTFTSPYQTRTTPRFPPSTPPPQVENGDVTSPTTPTDATADPEDVTLIDIKQHTKQAMVVAQARARAQVRKRHRSQSIMSVEGNPGAYRSRTMIIVYYDSFVQSFFEELVKFVSASRNLMRKAKMAAKVAHIKRLAELETPAADDDDDEDMEMRVPSMRYLSVRRAGGMPFARAGTRGMLNNGGPADFYDELDKALEYVQGMAEKAAHQFLRDGDCNEEIGNISRKLADTKVLAEKEMERILLEDPDMATQTESPHPRMHRPPAVRKDMSKDSTSPTRGIKESKWAMIATTMEADAPMEVDPEHLASNEEAEEVAKDAKPTTTSIPSSKLEPEPLPVATTPLVEPGAPTGQTTQTAQVA
jgi:hypothetical protein